MFHIGGSFLTSLLSLGVYLLQSYAIYRLAVVRGLPNPFFAFIPFFQLFMLGQIGDSMKHLNRRVYDVFASVPLAYALPIVSVAAVLLRYPFSTLADLLVSVGTLVVYYLVFYFYARKQCVLFTVIAGLPTIVSILAILSLMPLIGGAFIYAAGILAVAAVVTPVVGPLLILYSIRGYRMYR
ncbi:MULTISPECIES: hypothetical protein [Anaerotruncus]|uniref:hypothetical protein n=1 Tax=Anaerotruncus TaxID=244127 RepID=UPI00208C1150|nr:hypothetical protein [Anaerotruncus massiliensis (ex Togo et al. 2019)]GKH47469.1 hypothetical protein CE91St45_20310 [Oscillospiraceae bacterium]